ncbi:hypothetical protein AB837_00554 [bacterium AB1]|nr:hypothetical protein AB837_00554 [bacterium AB1]
MENGNQFNDIEERSNSPKRWSFNLERGDYLLKEELNSESYSKLKENYSLETSLKDYWEKSELYSFKQKIKSECEFYETLKTLYVEFDDPNEIYEELHLDTSDFQMDLNTTFELNELIIKDLGMSSDLLDELLEIQKEKEKICETFIEVEEGKILNIYICYALKEKKLYDSINQNISAIIREKYLTHNNCCSQLDEDHVINFVLKYLSFKNGYYGQLNETIYREL